MYLIGKITVTAVLPDRLKRLRDIAENLWWSWNSDAIDLYREIDLELWERLGKNPVRFLQEVSQKKLEAKLQSDDYLARYEDVVNKYDSYMSQSDTWYNQHYGDRANRSIAYFSAEFGLHEVLPVYSGGLGILSGDHLKSASDLGLPLTGVGIFYKQGYFSQRINSDGWQETNFASLNTSQLPIKPVLNDRGEEILISLELPGRLVYARVWRVQAGRVRLFLMDTDVEQNSSSDRMLTSRLYGGDQETRIQQEILLGIGGIKVLEALGISPSAYHMNEGHSAFAGLELIRRLVQDKSVPYRQAKEIVAASLVFTTHTPVPAGNDVFPTDMIDRYFNSYWPRLGIGREEFLNLGLRADESYNFNMTVLALKLAGRKNGVSELHGTVSRNIFNNVWPDVPVEDVPITHITNGIHTLTWLSPNFKRLYDKYLDNGWEEKLYEGETWSKVDNIPAAELWSTHCELKRKMIDFVRERLKAQRTANGELPDRIYETDTLLDPEALTIGFARRFATYKRANLIFRNLSRIQSIFNKPGMPIQIIFAGKAHPADQPANEIIKNINDIARQEGFRGKVVLLENYNMTVARNLVQGVDIWLNNPRKPLEASGTSGQKVCTNGIINFSILDGWWCEGYNNKNGWAIGDDAFHGNEHYQDEADSDSLYSILEREILPMFYNRDSEGIPVKWVEMMKESIKSVTPRFSTHRMVQDYTNKFYIPSIDRLDRISTNNYNEARELVEWKEYTEKHWPDVRIMAEKNTEQRTVSGEVLNINAAVYLGDIDPANVRVELYYGILGKNNGIENAAIQEMNLSGTADKGTYSFSAQLSLHDGGEYGYSFRVFPHHPLLINKFEMGLIRWADQ